MGNRQQCIEHLTRFCRQHKKSFEEILDVTSWFIAHSQYPPNADNFVYHIDKDGKEKSRLEISFDEYSPELNQHFI